MSANLTAGSFYQIVVSITAGVTHVVVQKLASQQLVSRLTILGASDDEMILARLP